MTKHEHVTRFFNNILNYVRIKRKSKTKQTGSDQIRNPGCGCGNCDGDDFSPVCSPLFSDRSFETFRQKSLF